MLAFIRRITVSTGSLFVMPLSADGKPAGDARELKQFGTYMEGLDWAQDGRSVLLSTGSLASSTIVRVYLDGRTVNLPLGQSAFLPSVAGKGNAMAFAQRLFDPNVWALDPANGRALRVVASTALDLSAALSPDGRRLVFVSTRAGSFDLWTSDADGDNPAKLTFFGKHVGAPAWSPDGSRIAFDSVRDGRWHVYVIGSGGGAARQVTFGDSTNVRPAWSPDGKWIYFGTDRAGQWRIFKVSADGGEPVPVTQQAGSEVFIAGEGGFLYYVHQGHAGVWRMPLNGGPEVKVLDKPRQSWWGASRQGIYFVDPDGPRYAIEFYAFATQKIERVGFLPEGTSPYPQSGRGFGVSSDGKILLYTAVDSEQGDLNLVENFR
jgi:Tol biopolymer transport system component